jgi:signal transduction histidine kinase
MVRLLTTGALLALTLLCVGYSALQVSPQSSRYTVELISYAGLVALAITLSIPIAHSQLSLAHAGTMLAFLSLPAFVAPAMTIAVFVGALIGSVIIIWVGWQVDEERAPTRANAYTGVFIIAGITLSFFASSHLYTDILRGNLPLKTVLLSEIASQGLVLLAYTLVHVAVYLAVFTLQLYSETADWQRVVSHDLSKLAIIVLLPLPFALVGVNIARRDESVVLYGMTMTAAALIVIGLFAVNGSERRWRRQAQELGVLSSATQALRGQLNMERLLEVVHEQVSQLLGVQNVTVALWLDHRHPIQYPLVVREGKMLTTEEKRGLPDDHALTRHVITTQTPLRIPRDVVQEAHRLGLLPPVPNTPNAWLGVPLLANEAPIGAIVVQSYDERTFTEGDLRLLNILATSAGIAFDNARLYSQKSVRAEQLAVLNQVVGLLTESLSPHEVLETVVSSAGIIFDADAVAVYVQPQGKGELYLARHSGFHAGHPAPKPLLLDGTQPLEQLTPLLIEDVLADGRAEAQRGLLLREKKRTLVELPLLLRGYLIGVLALYYTQPRSDLEEQLDVLKAFGVQVAQALNNARTYESTDKALSATLDQLKAILDAMEEGLVLFDADSRLVMVNPRMDLVGLTASRLIGQPLDRLLSDEEMRFSKRLGFAGDNELLALLEGVRDEAWQVPPPYDYVYEAEEGVRHLQRQAVAVRDVDQALIGILLIFYDKSEEHELATARESFTQMIVHDLRSPLTAVTTSLRLLGELVPRDAEYRLVVEKTTDISRRAIRKVLQRVDAMLDIAKLESGIMELEREPSSAGVMIENVRAELQPLADELAITLREELEPNLPLLDVDSDKVERLILNLVDNALKYAPAESTVVVRVTRWHETGFVRLDVVDNGVGVPDDYKQRLFDRFVQVSGRQIVRRGVGLGLNFCRLVSEAHGGNIWVEDNPEGGSVFSVTLPTFAG